MNLQIWWWAAKETNDPQWLELGRKHALKSAEWLVRADGSRDSDRALQPRRQPAEVHVERQGARVSQSRGSGRTGFHAHASGLRGRYRVVARAGVGGVRIRRGVSRHARSEAAGDRGKGGGLRDSTHLPEDGVPWYDFADEGVYFRNRDSSAAAILAGGLLRLAELTSATPAIIASRPSTSLQILIDSYLSPDGVLRHGCSTRPNDVGLVYGDYYLLETFLSLEHDRTKVLGAQCARPSLERDLA